MKAVGTISFFIFGFVVCYLMLSLQVLDLPNGSSTMQQSPSSFVDLIAYFLRNPRVQEEPSLSLPTYLSFVSVLLTSITVVLAALAIGIGIVAAYTFREIKDEAQKVASKTALAKADEALSDDVIQARIDKIAFRTESTKAMEELEENFDDVDGGEKR